MVQKVLRGLMHLDPARGHVLIDFLFAPLPAFGPEPGLVGWHRERRSQFQHAVGPLGYLDLRSRLVEV